MRFYSSVFLRRGAFYVGDFSYSAVIRRVCIPNCSLNLAPDMIYSLFLSIEPDELGPDLRFFVFSHAPGIALKSPCEAVFVETQPWELDSSSVSLVSSEPIADAAGPILKRVRLCGLRILAMLPGFFLYLARCVPITPHSWPVRVIMAVRWRLLRLILTSLRK
jgi:hypothetical protein